MFARATTIQAGADAADAGIEPFRDALARFREIPGNQGAFLLLDRGSGKGVGVTLWENEQTMTDSREQADQSRQQAAQQAQGQIVSVDEYEVAVWDVSA